MRSFANHKNQINEAMTEEQFSQVVEAILSGKYSWACVLILRSAGYNPLHYIPYRTYNRLVKENESRHILPQPEQQVANQENCKIHSLDHFREIDPHTSRIHGGHRFSLNELRFNGYK